MRRNDIQVWPHGSIEFKWFAVADRLEMQHLQLRQRVKPAMQV